MPSPIRPIIILGPTAGGKSELAVQLAERLEALTGHAGQIIGADSMQVYHHMDAGTAKPTPAQMQRATHHLINVVEPTERFTVSDWLERVDTLIVSLCDQGITPIVVGGTNLYLKALLEGLFDGPSQNLALRQVLEQHDNAKLHAKLREIDPEAGERIHPNDRKRMVRAIEVFEQTGKPISALQTQWGRAELTEGKSGDEAEAVSMEIAREPHRVDAGNAELPDVAPTKNAPTISASPDTEAREPAPYRHDPLLIGLQWSADDINPRINLRVKAMFYPGKVDASLAADVTPSGESLLAETARLEEAALLGPQAREALGYKQVLAAMRGEMTMDDAFERTKIQTRRFAKQQRTWLKRFRGVQWIECPADDVAEQAIGIAEGALK